MKFIQKTLWNLATSTEKKRKFLFENFPINAYIRPQPYVVEKYPFPHIVAEDFFTKETYHSLLQHFENIRARGFSEVEDVSRFQPFLSLTGKFEYDGYIYTPLPGENEAVDALFSIAWNLFFTKLFRQSTSFCTNVAYHYHPPDNRTGFIHHDHTQKTFSYEHQHANGVILQPRKQIDTKKDMLIQEWRRIALLYYLGNDGWQEGQGGETGLYAGKTGEPVKFVAPKNNRLLAFSISNHSFHAFQKNFVPRSCIVQWFHSPFES